MLVTIVFTMVLSLLIMIATTVVDRRLQLPKYKFVIVSSVKNNIIKLLWCAFCMVLLAMDFVLCITSAKIEYVISLFAFGLLFDSLVLAACIMECGQYVAFDGDRTIILHNCLVRKNIDASEIKRIYSSKGIIHFLTLDKRGKQRSLFSIEVSAIGSAEFVHAVDAIAKTPDD